MTTIAKQGYATWPVVSVEAVLLACLALCPWIGPNVFPPSLIAVLLCSWYGGIGPGLAATGLSSTACTVLLNQAVARH